MYPSSGGEDPNSCLFKYTSANATIRMNQINPKDKIHIVQTISGCAVGSEHDTRLRAADTAISRPRH